MLHPMMATFMVHAHVERPAAWHLADLRARRLQPQPWWRRVTVLPGRHREAAARTVTGAGVWAPRTTAR
jgi:hypothetical protein